MEGEATERAGGFVLDLVITTESGTTRSTLDDSTCDRVVDGAAIKVALAMDASALISPDEGLGESTDADPEPVCPEEEPIEDPAPVACPECPAHPESDVPPRSDAPPEPTEPRRVSVHTLTHVDWGTLPGVGPAFELGLSVRALRAFELEAYGLFVHPREFWLVDDPSQGGSLLAGGAGLLACPVLNAGPLEIPVCLGGEAGVVRARGLGGARTTVVHQARGSLLASGGLRWVVGDRLAVVGNGAVSIPLTRYAFSVSDTAYRARPMALRVGLGFAVKLGRAVR